MPKVVFDTVIFVRALFDSRSFSGRLFFEYSRSYHLFLSAPLVEEILEVLGRKEIIKRFHLQKHNYPEAIARLLKSMELAEVVKINRIPVVSRDPKDDKFLATAKESGADYLVSADKDLLDLKNYQGVKIIDAKSFLEILEQELSGKE